MKLKLSLLLLIITISISAQKFNTALNYLEFIGDKQTEITENSWKYTKAVAHSKRTAKIRQRRKILIRTIDKAINDISRTKAFTSGGTFKVKVIENLKLQKYIMDEDYSKIIDMKEVAENSYDEMEAYFLAKEMADKKLKEAQAEYEKAFDAYAKEYNINIIENKSDLGRKMKISSKVFKHYNEMYLLFFKVSFNETKMMEAIQVNDISGIQQSANALSQEAKLGIEKLNDIELYKNDNSLIKSTKEAFEFYIDEADNKIPNIIGFLLLTENFTKIKKVLENTPERKRTNKQINAFNAKVKQINKEGNNYNKINNELNNNRSNIINKYNSANSRFLSKHIPND